MQACYLPHPSLASPLASFQESHPLDSTHYKNSSSLVANPIRRGIDSLLYRITIIEQLLHVWWVGSQETIVDQGSCLDPLPRSCGSTLQGKWELELKSKTRHHHTSYSHWSNAVAPTSPSPFNLHR